MHDLRSAPLLRLPRRAWERETQSVGTRTREQNPGCSRSHALRGNACSDALRRVLKSTNENYIYL